MKRDWLLKKIPILKWNLKEIKCLHYNIKHRKTQRLMKIYTMLYQSLPHTAIKDRDFIKKSCDNNNIKYHVNNVYFWRVFTCSTDSTSGT